MARFAKPLQGSFSPVAKHPQKHKNRPEIGRFSHFNPSAEMHPFSLFSASKAPEKWLCDAICRKKQLFPTSRSGFLILHECLHLLKGLRAVLFVFVSLPAARAKCFPKKDIYAAYRTSQNSSDKRASNVLPVPQTWAVGWRRSACSHGIADVRNSKEPWQI